MTGPTTSQPNSYTSTDRMPAHVTRSEYDWADIHPTTAIIETVARSLDRDPIELTQLSDVIDTDAVDKILMNGRPSRKGDVSMSFTYEGHEVTAKSSGLVTVVSYANSS